MVKADCLNPSHGGSLRAAHRRKGDRCLRPVLYRDLPCLCRTLTGANPQGVGKDVMGTYVHTTFLA